MKFLYPFVIILVFTFLGELLNFFLPFPIPASVYGLILLFLGLRLGLVKLEKIEELEAPRLPFDGNCSDKFSGTFLWLPYSRTATAGIL